MSAYQKTSLGRVPLVVVVRSALRSFAWREFGITVLYGVIFFCGLYFGGLVSRNDAEEIFILVYSILVASAQQKRKIVNAIGSDVQHNSAQIAD